MARIALISFLANSLSIRLLAAYLRKNGFYVICVFCPSELNEKNASSLISLLRERSITLVGMTLVTDDYLKAVEFTRAVKKALSVSVIWGGAHPSISPEECLRHADMVCVGEGEDALLDVARSMSDGAAFSFGIKNIHFRTPKGVKANDLRDLDENLDKFPFPDHDFDNQYFLGEERVEPMDESRLGGVYSIMTSRGCPYSCCYCYNSARRAQYKGKGRYLRMRSIENVLSELKIAKAKFKSLKAVQFWDDTFLSRHSADFGVFSREYSASVNLPFFMLAEPMAFDPAKIELLSSCGLKSIQAGIQSGSERFNRDFYRRPVTNEKVLSMARTLNRLGITPIYDFIFNNPYETFDDLRETVDLLMSLPRPFQMQGYNLIFYPGSEITSRALADGHIVSKQSGSEDFSKIQGEENSPVSKQRKAVYSSRFYSVNFDVSAKAYMNSLIILASYPRAPKRVVDFFKRSETPVKRFLLYRFIGLYDFVSRLKNRRFRKCKQTL